MAERGHGVSGDVGKGSQHPSGAGLDQGQVQIVVAEKKIAETLLDWPTASSDGTVGKDMHEQFPPALHLLGGSLVQLLRKRPEADDDRSAATTRPNSALARAIRSASDACAARLPRGSWSHDGARCSRT